MNKETKYSNLKKYLIKKRSITTWDAISLFGETRLSARIFNLKNEGWTFKDFYLSRKDRLNNTSTYKVYTLLSYPKTKKNDKTC
jgi:hypothetical protein